MYAGSAEAAGHKRTAARLSGAKCVENEGHFGEKERRNAESHLRRPAPLFTEHTPGGGGRFPTSHLLLLNEMLGKRTLRALQRSP